MDDAVPDGAVMPAGSRAFFVAWEGTPSWETGRPQPVVTRLLAEGAIHGRVLDAGCGTGLHAAMVARAGHDVVGVDLVPRAVELARTRAREAGVAARFVVADALELPRTDGELGAPFDTVLDVGLFHVLQPGDRRRYAAALAAVARTGAAGFVVAWSERNPFGIGPGRVTRRAIRDAFRAATGWRVESIEAATLETRLPMGHAEAWLARLRRR